MNGSAPVRVRILSRYAPSLVIWDGSFVGPFTVAVDPVEGFISIPGCPDLIRLPARVEIDQPGPPSPMPARPVWTLAIIRRGYIVSGRLYGRNLTNLKPGEIVRDSLAVESRRGARVVLVPKAIVVAVTDTGWAELRTDGVFELDEVDAAPAAAVDGFGVADEPEMTG